MAGRAPGARGETTARGRRFAIVVSRFHEQITTRLVEGALGALRRRGVADRDVSVVWVPGAFEIPQVAMRVARRERVDALVCLGCVIRGETPHFEYVAGEAARGIAEVGRRSGVPATFGVITAETMEQAMARAGGTMGNRGEEAALAALELVTLLESIDGSARQERGARSLGGGRPGASARPGHAEGTRAAPVSRVPGPGRPRGRKAERVTAEMNRRTPGLRPKGRRRGASPPSD